MNITNVHDFIAQAWVWLIILAFILNELVDPVPTEVQRVVRTPIRIEYYGDSILMHLERKQ